MISLTALMSQFSQGKYESNERSETENIFIRETLRITPLIIIERVEHVSFLKFEIIMCDYHSCTSTSAS